MGPADRDWPMFEGQIISLSGVGTSHPQKPVNSPNRTETSNLSEIPYPTCKCHPRLGRALQMAQTMFQFNQEVENLPLIQSSM